jgi:hypothetical protein
MRLFQLFKNKKTGLQKIELLNLGCPLFSHYPSTLNDAPGREEKFYFFLFLPQQSG